MSVFWQGLTTRPGKEPAPSLRQSQPLLVSFPSRKTKKEFPPAAPNIRHLRTSTPGKIPKPNTPRRPWRCSSLGAALCFSPRPIVPQTGDCFPFFTVTGLFVQDSFSGEELLEIICLSKQLNRRGAFLLKCGGLFLHRLNICIKSELEHQCFLALKVLVDIFSYSAMIVMSPCAVFMLS